MLHEALSFACRQVTARGATVRCQWSAFLPGPERLLTFFEAEGPEAVRRVNENAHAPFIHLEPVVRIGPLSAAGDV